MIVVFLVLLFKHGEGVKVEAVEENVQARYGSWATLSVTIDSDPHPTLEEISWYKGTIDNKVTEARHSVGGQGTQLNIALTRTSDYTSYTCRVTGGEGLCKSCTDCTGSCGNCCASLTLTPTEQSGANVKVTQTKELWTAGDKVEALFSELGSTYIVEQVTWFKGIYPLTTGGRYTIIEVSNTRFKFNIEKCDASDNGDYAVVYKTSSDGSILYGILEFAISVLGNPVVMVTPQTARVTESSDVTFTCTAQASSTSPTYRWDKNGVEIQGKVGEELTISDVEHENAAEYKCTVSFTHDTRTYTDFSIAYLVINDDTVLEVLTPFLLADVTSQQAVLSFKVTSRVNEPVTGDMVTWYKDSVVILDLGNNGIAFASARNNLIISNPTAEHEGHYRVMVQLTTITLEGSMQLAVTSALPTIKFNSGTFVGRSGEQLIFTIEVGGNPVPDVHQIEWYLNNKRLYQGDINVRFSDNYLQLYRSKLTKKEDGLVKVVVETSAGRTEETAEVLIIKQNDIQKTKSSENQLLGKSLQLSVLFYMMPLPVGQNVQWTRSSDILTDTDPRIEFYLSGQQLLIKNVALEDAGAYTITVNKPDGETVREELLVSVRTKTERLAFSTTPTDATVGEGSTAIISCDITGTPSPTISFQFANDTKIVNSGRFYVTATSLEVWATEVSDTANYKCQGNNGDETVSADFKLTVNQRIVIEAEKAEVPATIGGSAHFTVYIQPTNAKVSWTRQGVNFPESDGGHYDVQIDHNHVREGAQYRREILTISTVQSSDLGTYEATASYSEGKYVRAIEVKLTNGGSNVIAITAATGDKTAYQGQSAKFSCSVSIDQSTITWTRNGVDVTKLEESVKARYVLSASKQELTVTSTVPDDEGLYLCTVSSDTGRDQASATLTVIPPIKITEYPVHRRLLVGSGDNFLLSVTVVSGDPASQIISWTLGGAAINGDTTSISPNVPSLKGTSIYSVTASLPSWLSAGSQSDQATIYVTTYDVAAEAIIIQAPTDQTAILGSTVTFECVAYGIPDPSIRWTSGSAEMDSSYFNNKYTDRGVESQLVISNVKPQFQGDYRCKADNLKGSMQTKPAYLEIINPPSVRLVDSVYYGVPGKELVVHVEVNYQNTVTKSMCKWTRNGVVLQEEGGKIEFGTDGTTLKISSVESSSAGTYSFTIETEAGSATTSTSLEIIASYILPSATIPPYHSDVVALRGSVYHLKCQVAGKPVPKVTWRTKEGDTTLEFKDTGDKLQYSVQPDSSLKIASVRNNDTGVWTCVAESSPESVTQTTEAHLVLQVVEWLARPFVYPYHGHKEITVVSGDTLEANIEVMYRYQIRAHNIVWKRLDFGRTDWDNAKELNMVDPGYDNVVSFARDRRQLMIGGISRLFEGQYCATVKTVAGEANTTISVYVISRVPPQIRWEDTIAGAYYTVNGEHDFVFNVNVTGEPFPKEITWYKKTGQEYEGIRNGTIGNYFYLIGYYGDLYMRNPDKSSAGFYKIQVTPEKGGQDQMKEESVELVVKDYYLGFQTAPYVGGIQKIGVPVTLTCLARGVPDPESVVWYRGITRLGSTSSQHTIPAVSKEDKGDYYCVATNSYGTIYSPKVSLQVQYLDSDFSAITCYKEEKSNGEISMKTCTQTNLIEGDVFSLRCNSPDGWPYPKTTWYFNNNPIADNINGIDPAPNQYGDLIFPWADPGHSGKYGCQVTNDEASKSNYHPEFDVKVAPSDDTSVDNAKTAEWLIQPGDVTVAQHTPVTIACLVSSFPAPTYKWTFDGNTLQTFQGKRELTFGGRLLTFDLIDEDSDGNYACVTTSKEGVKTAGFKLKVATRPAFVNAPIFMVGYIGNETEIDLGMPSGHPVPTVVWTFNGEGVQLGDRIKLIDTKKLRIDPTQKGDRGVWQATATNKAGSAQHAIYLKVEEPLEFVEYPSPGGNTYAAQYSTVRFPCNVRGTPPPQIYKWSRDDHMDQPFNGLPARAYMDQNHSLIIPYAQTWDNGTYVCNVTNEYFEYTWGSAVLIVVEPPSIVQQPQDYNINDFGESSMLTCKCEPQAVALQKCEVEWRRKGVKITDLETSVKVVDFASELTISSTQDRHLGKYECYGYNQYGSASSYAYITKSNKPYMITKPPDKLTTSSKSSVHLECNAIGFPPIHYMWTFNNLPIEDYSPDRVRMEVKDSGTLLIDGALSADTGTFTCYASNPYGQASTSTLLVVNGPPTTPTSPWVSKILRDNNNQYSATIKIQTDKYKYVSISKYILTATETEGGATTTVSTSENPYQWNNLDSRAYTFSVVLQNNIEASKSSEPSGRIDFRDYNDIPKTSVTGVKVSADNATLKWDVLSGADSYKIYQWRVGSEDSRSYLGLSNSNEYTIAGISVLLPFTQYDFQIVPVGSAGKEGLYSEPLRVRTQPKQPLSPEIGGFSNTTNPGEIIVEFDRRWQSSSGILKEFQVYFERTNQDYHSVSKKTLSRNKRQSGGSVTALSAAVNVIVSDLVPGEEYTFSVTSENEQGIRSEKSTSETKRTQTGKPEVPTIYFLEGSGRDAIEVKWNAPSIANGEILGYYVYYRLDNSFNDVAARVVAPILTTSYNVTGLDEGFRYEFAVSAFTSAGEGDKTAWEDMTPRSKSIPNKMDTPKVSVISWNTVNVSWKLEDDGLTGIDTFTIYLDSAINRGGQSSYVIPNRNDRHAQITSLDEDTIYALSIVSTNHIGSSSRSNPYEFRTYKKALYLRAWFAGMVTGIVAFLLLVLFSFLFYVYVYKRRVPPVKEEKKAPIPYIGREGGGARPDNRSLVLGNPARVPLHEAERYSSRNSRADNYTTNRGEVRMSDLRERQHYSETDNYSYNSKHRRQYEEEGYAPSLTESYNKEYYKEYDNAPDRYHDNKGPPHYNKERGGYSTQYDDADRFSSDNQRPAPRGDYEEDGFVIDNPAAARFSQI